MFKISKYILAVLVALFLGGGSASAGTVVLDSGARVKGKVTERRNKVMVETKDGTHSFHKSLVKTINRSAIKDPGAPGVSSQETPGAAVEQESAGSTTESAEDLGRGYGPVRKVKYIYVVSPSYVSRVGDSDLKVQRTTHYVKGWDTTGGRDEPVLGTIRSGTSIGETRRGGLRFSHTGRPRFRTFSWETDQGTRKIQLPTQTRIRVRRRK